MGLLYIPVSTAEEPPLPAAGAFVQTMRITTHLQGQRPPGDGWDCPFCDWEYQRTCRCHFLERARPDDEHDIGGEG